MVRFRQGRKPWFNELLNRRMDNADLILQCVDRLFMSMIHAIEHGDLDSAAVQVNLAMLAKGIDLTESALHALSIEEPTDIGRISLGRVKNAMASGRVSPCRVLDLIFVLAWIAGGRLPGVFTIENVFAHVGLSSAWVEKVRNYFSDKYPVFADNNPTWDKLIDLIEGRVGL